MCGIVGLLLKDPGLRPRLGELMVPMMIGMTERGPDSAGLAVFTEPVEEGTYKISLYTGEQVVDWKGLLQKLRMAIDAKFDVVTSGNHAVLTSTASPSIVEAWIAEKLPQIAVLSIGRSIDLYKDIGAPADICKRYGFAKLQGTHLVGHTRMATESAVTPAHAHPFTAGHDFCLVHNGSLSNPHLVRRKLEPLGIEFETDNDTEAACRYFEWRLREGDDLKTAVQRGFEELDGFYTFLMGTDDELAIVRDAFACKPAIVAETDDYVAIASEFRSLAHLPGVHKARLFEPKPQEVYAWKV
ncbi:amidophosphoribosyltransferase [Povalibacter uvarum]|uniref:Amidophosphoribosyltransferase n=1 Tax=Povalibacter uvarum TaxID=732238 RepID=A0A841HJI8_9GAMM|nr:class II glutamine amidotransferase [Povalibacter uvarum]MBB6092754.1 amidophosphoribosyltransferase [Povalibacter uvarum]